MRKTDRPRELVGQPQAGVQVLDVLEVDERLVEQHVHVVGQRAQQPGAASADVEVGAGGVVGVAEHEHPRALADGPQQRLDAVRDVHRHRLAPARAAISG